MMTGLIRRALRWLPPATIVRVVTGPLKGARWMIGAAPHGAWLGRFERPQLDDFAAHSRAGGCVWDVGAHVGLYTLTAARRVTPRGAVVAFEPVPANAAVLDRHLTLNACDWVQVVRMAVTDHVGHVRMHEDRSSSECRVDPDGTLEVPSTTLDAWHAAHGGPLPDIIKIDTEGAEAAVLRGGAGVIQQARPRLYLALHGDDRAADCAALLESWGYQRMTVDGSPLEGAAEWIATAGRDR